MTAGIRPSHAGDFDACHRRRPNKEQPATRFAKDQLKAIVERIERLEEEKKATSDDIRDVYAEAKGNGFDVKALRTIVRLRKHGHRRAPRAAGGARDLHARARDVAVGLFVRARLRGPGPIAPELTRVPSAATPSSAPARTWSVARNTTALPLKRSATMPRCGSAEKRHRQRLRRLMQQVVQPARIERADAASPS